MPGFKKANARESLDGMKDVKSGTPFFSPKGGEKANQWGVSRIRILPPREDHPNDRFYLWAATHGNLPGSDFPVYCPQKNGESPEPCAACAISRRYYQAGDKDNGLKFSAGFRGLTNVLLLNQNGDELENDEVLVWAVPRTLLEDISAKILEVNGADKDPSIEPVDITDPIDGYDIILRRKGSKIKDTRYEVAVCPESTPIPEAALDLLDNMHDLTEVYPPVDGDRIKLLLEAPEGGDHPALPAGDPFDTGDDDGPPDGAVDGQFKELFPDDEGEEEPDEEETPPPADSKEKARAGLAEKLAERRAAAAAK